MNILAITPDFYPKETGYSIACQNLYKALIDNNVADKMIVCSPHEKEYNYKNRISSIHFPYPRGRSLIFRVNSDLAIKYYEVIMKKKIDLIKDICAKNNILLIIVESLEWGWFSYILSKKLEIPIVTRIHGTLPEYTAYTKKKSFRSGFIKYAFRTDNIATTTYHYIDFFQSYFKSYEPFFGKNFFIIPNTLEKSEQFTKEKSNKDEIIFFQLGRMDEFGYHQKGFDDSLKAFIYLEQVLESEVLVNVKYIVIGDGENAKKFETNLNKLKYINVEYYSSKSNYEVKEILKKSDVVLMPSRAEGMSMFATEALAYGKAFIYTENNGLRDMIFDECNGLKMRNYDYLQLSEAMGKYIKNPSLAEKFGKKSLELFEKEFSYKAVAQKFKVVVEVLVNEKNDAN